jgi:hypothetical protein
MRILVLCRRGEENNILNNKNALELIFLISLTQILRINCHNILSLYVNLIFSFFSNELQLFAFAKIRNAKYFRIIIASKIKFSAIYIYIVERLVTVQLLEQTLLLLLLLFLFQIQIIHIQLIEREFFFFSL